MADDIDIEEHDLMENPRIKDILPHFSIKSEPVDLDEEPIENYEEYQYDEEQHGEQEYDENEMEDTPFNDSEMPMVPYEQSIESGQSKEVYHHTNKIILGTKPCFKSSPIILGSKSGSKSQNPIILSTEGSIQVYSKPCPKSHKVNYEASGSEYIYSRPSPKSRKHPILRALLCIDSDPSSPGEPYQRPERVPEDATVFLEDWGVRLAVSPCYCKECQTLFATRNALDAHNMVAHSFLVAMDSPERPKSPEVEKPQENPRYCNQCHTYFTNDNLLIQHLYEHLTANNVLEKSSTRKVYYKCPICFSYYVSIIRFRRHMDSSHNSSLETVKKVPFDPVCGLCNRKTTFLSHNKHIQHSHKEYRKKVNVSTEKVPKLKLPKDISVKIVKNISKNVPKGKPVKIAPKQGFAIAPNNSAGEVKRPKYKCIKCKTIYKMKSTALYHAREKHPGEKYTVVLVGKKSTSNYYQNYKSLLPKDVNFKCNKCHITLLCATSVNLHNVCSASSRGKWTCRDCDNFFNYRDMNYHKAQHEKSEKIKIYKFSENIYDKVLCKCASCNVYFDEKTFLNHQAHGCANTEASKWCAVCKVKVNKFPQHKAKHSVKKPSRTDYIFIDNFFSTKSAASGAKNAHDGPKKNLKRKLPPSAAMIHAKKAKSSTSFYYCKVCGIFGKYLKTSDFHQSKLCETLKGRALPCRQCGLRIHPGKPFTVHTEDHEKYKWDFKDFVFFDIVTAKPIAPPLPEFPSCVSCGVQHINEHTCSDPKKVCTICNKEFDRPAYDLHAMHHKYMTKSMAMDDVSELIQRYESLKSTWNIVYRCGLCDVATDSYDRAVDHSQLHLTSHSQIALRRTCDICSISFDDISIKKHRELHTNKSITKSSFNVFKYEHRNLLSDSWFGLYTSLSQAEIEQITASSIYVTRAVKMNVILNGPPEFSIYKCESCKNYVDASDVYAHTHSCDGSSNCHACSICGIPFSSAEGLEMHQKIHNKSNITANSYRIIAFNAKADRIINDKLKEALNSSNENVDPADEIVSSPPGSSQAETTKYTFYQCRQCRSCSMFLKFVDKHRCLLGTDVWKCKKCPYRGSGHGKQYHLKWHSENPTIKRADIVTVPFEKLAEFEGVKRFYYSQCSICKVLLKSSGSKHQCGSKNVVRKCGKCKYKFHVKAYEQHRLHHMKDKHLTRESIEILPFPVKNEKKLEVMKSEIHFTYQRKKHSGIPSPLSAVKSEPDSFSHHKSVTRKQMKVENVAGDAQMPNQLDISTQSQAPILKKCTYEKVEYENVLHKCRCGLHFLTLSAIFDHQALKCHKGERDGVTCTLCGFTFTPKSLKRHVAIHHDIMGLTTKDFVVQLKGKLAFTHKSGPLKPQPFSYNSIYECGTCHVHLFNRIIARKHFLMCPTSEGRETCGYCNLEFTESSLLLHRTQHHKIRMFTSQNIHVFLVAEAKHDDDNDFFIKTESEDNRKLYKCTVCDLHYVDNASLKEHSLGLHDEEKVECDACGLLFTAEDLIVHATIHHEQINLTIDDFDVVLDKMDMGEANVVDKLSSNDNAKTIRTPVKTQNTNPSEPLSVILKCEQCDMCYLTFYSIKAHFASHKTVVNPTRCDKCGLNLSSKAIERHRKIHHGKKKVPFQCIVVRENDDVFKTSDENLHNGKTLYKCTVCSMHFIVMSSLIEHMAIGDHNSPHAVYCTDCGIIFTEAIFAKHMSVHHLKRSMKLEDFRIETLNLVDIPKIGKSKTSAEIVMGTTESSGSLTDVYNAKEDIDVSYVKPDLSESALLTNVSGKVDDSANLAELDTSDVNITSGDAGTDVIAVSQSSDLDASVNEKASNTKAIKLYKCGQCNVFFLYQSTCYKHTLNHVMMDPKDYIECKICSLQFSILSLAQHIKKHHGKHFELSNVLVEEYQPKKAGEKTPKIDIYYAIDKVQSRLVSTTTDDEKEDAAKSSQDVTQSHIDEPTDSATAISEKISDKHSNKTLDDKSKSLDSVNGEINDQLGKDNLTNEVFDNENICAFGASTGICDVPDEDSNKSLINNLASTSNAVDICNVVEEDSIDDRIPIIDNSLSKLNEDSSILDSKKESTNVNMFPDIDIKLEKSKEKEMKVNNTLLSINEVSDDEINSNMTENSPVKSDLLKIARIDSISNDLSENNSITDSKNKEGVSLISGKDDSLH